MDIFKDINVDNVNLHYWNRYKKFIITIQNKGRRKLQYIEKHHIIPKCINFKLVKDKNNIINLTPREHYIAHKILSYCFKQHTEEYNKLIFALFAMSKLHMKNHHRDTFKVTSRDYEQLRIKFIEARRLFMKQHIQDR